MPEIPNNIETETPLEIRKKYLLAMAIVLGVDEARASENIERLFQEEQELGQIQCNRSLREFDAKTVATIRRIGSLFLSGNANSGNYSSGDNRDFAVGKKALELMRAPLDSDTFNGLREIVKDWNFGQGAERFDEIINGER